MEMNLCENAQKGEKMKKPDMPELSQIKIKQCSVLPLISIKNFFNKIKLNLFLEKRRKNFIKYLINNSKELKLIKQYNNQITQEMIEKEIIKTVFEEQTGIKYDALMGKIDFVELMFDFKETNDAKRTILRLKLLEKLKEHLKEKHKNIKALDYNAFRDKFMIKFLLYVNENTYFEYQYFLNVKKIDEMLQNVN